MSRDNKNVNLPPPDGGAGSRFGADLRHFIGIKCQIILDRYHGVVGHFITPGHIGLLRAVKHKGEITAVALIRAA